MQQEFNQTQIDQAIKSVQQKIGNIKVDTAVICGSGLAGLTDGMVIQSSVSFTDIVGFPDCKVAGHKGQLVVAQHQKKTVIVMQGRLHLYEGLPPQIYLLYLGLLKGLGVKQLIITNAVGGIRQDLVPGDIVVLQDQINLTGKSPLVGLSSTTGGQFVGMEHCFSQDLNHKIESAAHQVGLSLKQGVYLGTLGPNFETPAEIKAFAVLGGDVVGMSTVLEVIAARYFEISVAGLSIITNHAAGISEEKITHDLTLSTARSACQKVIQLIQKTLEVI